MAVEELRIRSNLPSLKANEDLNEVVAFCDIIEERAEKAAKGVWR